MTGCETENRRKVAIVGILNGLSVGGIDFIYKIIMFHILPKIKAQDFSQRADIEDN